MSNKINPSLLSQLKRALGNPEMSTNEALQKCLDISIENRGLKSCLHTAIVSEVDCISAAAKRHVDAKELKFARIRKVGAK